jgi:hypothetical protein
MTILQGLILILVLASIARAVSDVFRRPNSLAQLAKAVNGRLLPARGGRPRIEGTYEGLEIGMSFPVRWAASSDQELRVTFRCPSTPDCRIRRRHAIDDLTRRSTRAFDSEMLTERVDYVFSKLRGSDLVIENGIADMSVRWPWTASGLEPHRVMLVLSHIYSLVQMCRPANGGAR